MRSFHAGHCRASACRPGVAGYVRCDGPPRAEPEDLDELPLDQLRDLDLEEASDPDLPAHVASASGVARRGRNVYVIGDESNHLAVFDLTSDEPGTLRPRRSAARRSTDPGERAQAQARPRGAHRAAARARAAPTGSCSGSARDPGRSATAASPGTSTPTAASAGEPARGRPLARLRAPARRDRRPQRRGRRGARRGAPALPPRQRLRLGATRSRGSRWRTRLESMHGDLRIDVEEIASLRDLRARRARRRRPLLQRRHPARRRARRLHRLRRGRRRRHPRLRDRPDRPRRRRPRGCAGSTASGRSRASTRRSTPASSTCSSSATRTTRTPRARCSGRACRSEAGWSRRERRRS